MIAKNERLKPNSATLQREFRTIDLDLMPSELAAFMLKKAIQSKDPTVTFVIKGKNAPIIHRKYVEDMALLKRKAA